MRTRSYQAEGTSVGCLFLVIWCIASLLTIGFWAVVLYLAWTFVMANS